MTKEVSMRKKKDENSDSRTRITRRGFLQLVGVGAAASAASPGLGADSARSVIEPVEVTRLNLSINETVEKPL